MNILIIGSKGFIGSHAVNYFKNKNNTVFECDVVVDYNATNYFLINPSNADFHDIFGNTTFDVCINCSGAASVPDSVLNPHRDFELNVTNVFKILDAIRRYQPNCKFINLSSAAIYGNPSSLPIQESSLPNPVSPYGFHKLMAENILKEFNILYSIPTLSLRLFSVYGPQLKKQLFWDIYKKIVAGNKNIEFSGTGFESRDFIYIDDVLQVFDLIISTCTFDGRAINIANGTETTINQAIETFIDVYNWQGNVHYSGKNRLGDPTNWKADISIIQSLGYIPSYTIKNGITQYIKWLKEKI